MADGVAHGHVAILLEVRERASRRINRDMREVRAPEPLELGVEVGKVASLQQGVVGEINAGRNVLCHERDLFRLGEEVVWHTYRVPSGRQELVATVLPESAW